MKRGIKVALYLSAVFIASGAIMTGIGALAGGYDQLDEVNGRFGSATVRYWNLPWAYSMHSLPGLGNLIDALERKEDRLEARTDEFEDSVERAADSFANSVEQAANSFEDSVENGNWGTFGTYNGEEKEAGQEVYSGDFETDIVSVQTLNSLEVESGIHRVEIKEGSGTDIHVKGAGCDKIQVYVKGGTLYVKDVEKKKLPKNIQADENTRHVVLTVPSGTEWREAELSADMGYVSMDVLQAVDAELDADMGAIEIGTAVVAEMDVDADMGSVEVKEAKAGRLKTESSMGSITFSGVVEGDVEAEAEMGSIRLLLRQKETDFNYRISADMGTVSINGKDFSGLSEDRVIKNDANKKMELDSSMGSIEILFD